MQKGQQLTPWDLQQSHPPLDRIMMNPKNSLQGRLNILNMVAINKIGQKQLSSELLSKKNGSKQVFRQNKSREHINNELTQPSKEKMHLKKIQISSLLGIGKGLVGEVAVLKKELQDKMRRYLLLIYLSQQLKREVASSKNDISKQKFQCLFPIIGTHNVAKSKYKARRSLNDLISLEKP